MRKIKLIDLFCGSGGYSSGAKKARHKGNPICEVIAGVNHDPLAIASHRANHPETVHYEEDVRDFKVIGKIARQVEEERKKDANVFICMHASMECTNYSLAKGGMSKDADSRSLPEHMPDYLRAFMPECFTAENVKEFLLWGPLIVKTKIFDGIASMLVFNKKEKRLKPHLIPDPKKKKIYYERWVNEIKSLGYDYEYRILNSADFGANTSRPRYFGVFTKKGLPILFPEPTHSKKPTVNKKKWEPVRPCLDLNDRGESIFAKKKMPVEPTLKRYLAGLIKQVAKGDTSFLVKHYSSLDPMANTKSLDEPAGSITTVDHHAIVNCEPFIDAYYGNGYSSSTSEPLGVITTKDRFAMVSTEQFLTHDYSGGNNSSIEEPCWGLTTTVKTKVLSVDGFIVNPGHFGHTVSLDNPCPVIVARQDKAPLSILMTDAGEYIIEVNKSDSETLKKIKCFMAYFGIRDIRTRMLKVSELKKIQGFDDDYILEGSNTAQKKSIGNSVVPVCAQRLIESIYQANLL